MRFTRVELLNWRNFTQANVALRSRVFVLGPNASGKSNFLDAFRFLHDVVAVGGGFQEAVRRRGGVSKVRSLAARKQSQVRISATIGDGSQEDSWTYELEFSAAAASDSPIIVREKACRCDTVIMERPDTFDTSDRERLKQTHLENASQNREFRIISEFFASISYLHIVPQLVREPDRSVGRTNDPFGGDLVEQIAKTPKKKREARIRAIQNALRVAVPQLDSLELWFDEKNNKQRLRGKYQHWRPQGAWQTEESFSDGTLRLFGLLWALSQDQGPLLLEEPELSLHPAIVRQIPKMFGRAVQKSRRQVIISSHSADLLEDEGIGLDEVLLLAPQRSEGTQIQLASNIERVTRLLDSGFSLGESVMPEVAPPDAVQLSLFGA